MIIFCFCVFFWNLASVCVSAEGAAFIGSPHRADSPWRTWGNAQGSWEPKTRALKSAIHCAGTTRISTNASEIENQPLDESRFQRLFEHRSNSWGDAPG